MADRIIVDFQALDRISGRLNAAGRELDQAMSQLARLRVTKDVGAYVRISGCETSLRTIGMTVNAETVSAAVSSYRSAVGSVSWYTSRLGKAVQNVFDLFESTENGLSGKKLDTGEKAPTGDGAESKASDSPAWDFLLDWLKKATGKAGILGTILSAALSISPDESGFESLAKYLAKTVPASVKWAAGLKEGEILPSLVGLQKYLKEPAAQGAKWARMATDFKNGLAKGLTSYPAWIAAGVSSAFKNAAEYKAGDISFDRAVFETLVETAGTVALGAATAAGVAAAIPSAPVLAVGVVSTFVICAGDAVVSHYTGKGIVETAGSFCGNIYDGVKQLRESTKATVANGWKVFSLAVAAVFSRPLLSGGGSRA